MENEVTDSFQKSYFLMQKSCCVFSNIIQKLISIQSAFYNSLLRKIFCGWILSQLNIWNGFSGSTTDGHRNPSQLDLYSNGIYGFYTIARPDGKGFSGRTTDGHRNPSQLDLYSNGIYGFYTSPDGKGFSGRSTDGHRNPSQLDLFCNGIYGFCTSPDGKGFSSPTTDGHRNLS